MRPPVWIRPCGTRFLSATENTASEIAEGLSLQEQAARTASEQAEAERRAADAAERRAKTARLRREEEAREATVKAERERKRAAARAERERLEAAAEAERARLEAAERVHREQMAAAKYKADAARAASAREAERKRALEERERRGQLIGRILFAIYVVGAFGLFVYLWRRELAIGSIYNTRVFLYPVPFGIVGGLLGKKLLDPYDRHEVWPFVVLGIGMWLVAGVVGVSFASQRIG